jgi:UDP-glucose:(heptosyl)LPS alpha-1,3-glucosyltransferase
MKIALAVEHFDAGHGGAEQYAWGLARWLVRQGHSVEVFAAHAAFPPPGLGGLHSLSPRPCSAAGRSGAMAEALRHALNDRDFDVVHAFNHLWPCDVLRLDGGVHRAFEEWNARSDPTSWGRVVRRLARRLGRRDRALRKNESRQFGDPRRRFVAVSQRVAQDMRRFYPDCEDRIRLNYNGVDLQRFSSPSVEERLAARAAMGFSEDETVLLFVSNNYRLKGLHDLVGALPLVVAGSSGRVRLVVAGRGRARPFVRSAMRLGVGDRVMVCPPGGDMRGRYAAADVLVHPTYYDSFGLVGLEAMACGLPVVMSRNAGMSELITSGRGAVLIDMPCPREELSAAILAASRPSFRAEARVHNRIIAEQYPVEASYLRMSDIYREVVQAKGG